MILNLPYRPHSEGNPSGLFHSSFYVCSSQKDIRITEWPLRWSSRSFDILLGNCSFSPETLIQVACMIQVKYEYNLLDPRCFLAVIRDFINGTFLAPTTETSSFFLQSKYLPYKVWSQPSGGEVRWKWPLQCSSRCSASGFSLAPQVLSPERHQDTSLQTL